MDNETSHGEGIGGCSSKGAPSTCCQSVDEKDSSCCNPKGGSWGKGKALLAALIIMMAIGVGTVSFMRGKAAQPLAATSASCPPTQCGAASCQSVVSKPGSSCPTPSQCGAASCTK